MKLCRCLPLMPRTETQWEGAGVRGCKAADYLCEAYACEGQELGRGGGGGKAPFPVSPPLLMPQYCLKVANGQKEPFIKSS